MEPLSPTIQPDEYKSAAIEIINQIIEAYRDSDYFENDEDL